MATASTGQLAELNPGTAAHRYFEEGGERMVAALLGTLAPALGCLKRMAGLEGPSFSVRD